MLFIEINGETYPAEVRPFTTQIGTNAIRVISSEAPVAENGFKVLDVNDDLVIDCSKFIRLYREDGDCKEYIEKEESVIPVEGSYMGDVPPSPYSILSQQILSVSSSTSSQINELSSHVDDVTPYTESKIAYIGDTEVSFDIAKQGNVNAYLVVNGQQVPCEVTIYENYILVTFDELEEVGTVTISIQ